MGWDLVQFGGKVGGAILADRCTAAAGSPIWQAPHLYPTSCSEISGTTISFCSKVSEARSETRQSKFCGSSCSTGTAGKRNRHLQRAPEVACGIQIQEERSDNTPRFWRSGRLYPIRQELGGTLFEDGSSGSNFNSEASNALQKRWSEETWAVVRLQQRSYSHSIWTGIKFPQNQITESRRHRWFEEWPLPSSSQRASGALLPVVGKIFHNTPGADPG